MGEETLRNAPLPPFSVPSGHPSQTFDGLGGHTPDRNLACKLQTKTKTSTTIADLKRRWDQLDDLDRGRAVHKIHKSGTTFYSLAKALGCSPSLLRNLCLADQAPAPDRLLARQRKISTRELVRRAKHAKALQAEKASEALERERKQHSERVCEAICDFVDRKQWTPQYAELLVDEARRYLAFAEAAQLIPPKPFPPLRLPLVEVLERLWPLPTGDPADETALFAESLVKFVVAALPDSISRHRALGLALKNQMRRP